MLASSGTVAGLFSLRDQGAELERLLELGARPAGIGQAGEEPWHVLADPEGNAFCLLKARLDRL